MNSGLKHTGLRSQLLVGIAGAALVATPVNAQSVFTTDVSVATGLSTNPLQSLESTGTSPSITVDVVPRLVVEDALTTYHLDGFLRFEEYLDEVQSTSSYGVNGLVENRLSELTSISANVGFNSSIVGVNDAFFLPVDPTNQPVIVPDIADDIGLIGQNSRRNQLQAGIGLSSKLSSIETINASLAASALRYDDAVFQTDYNYYSQSIGYSRQVSEVGNVGVSLALGETDYLGSSLGDAFTATPTVTWSSRIASDLTVSASLGVAFTRLETGTGRTSSSDLAGSLNICRNREYNNFCLGASRNTLPTSFGGVRTQTSIDFGYSQRLNRTDDLRISASYSHSSNSIVDDELQAIDYVRGSARFSHRFGDRLSGFVSAGYSDTFGFQIDRKPNFEGNVGISYRFGNIR